MNKNDPIYISSNIKHLRTIKRQSQQELGKALGYGASAIGNWESGLRKPNAIDLYFLSRHFGISIDDLVSKDLRFEDYINDMDKKILEKIQSLSDNQKEKVIDLIEIIK